MIGLSRKRHNPMYALRYLLTGLRWLSKKSLRRFLLIPIAINFLVYSLAFGLGYVYLGELINQLIPNGLQWLSWLLWPLYFIIFIIGGFFSFTVLANIIAAPFYGLLAEKTAELIEISAVNSQFDSPEIRPNWLKTTLGELRRLRYLAGWGLLLIIISMIPGINLIAPLLWILFGAWGYALEFFAYPLENQGLIFDQQQTFIRSIRLGALSFGGLVLVGLSIPLINLLISPAAVIGATLYVHALRSQSSNEFR